MTAQPPTISENGAKALDALLHKTVARQVTPAVFLLATNAKETIYENQAGERIFGDAKSGQVDPNTVLELFSQTKLVTAIAALQLVDRGLVSLDCEADVEKYLPEVKESQVLSGYGEDGQARFVKPKNRVTLRMLLAHTSGFVYPFLPSALSSYFKLHPADTDPLQAGSSVTTLCKPLAHEPGTSWVYGIGSDLAGKLIERVSGLRLDSYFQEHIFSPLGLTTLTFFPTDEVKKNKMAVCVRSSGDKVRAIRGGFGGSRPNDAGTVPTELLSGGAGLYGTQRDVLAILRAILRCDPSSSHHSSTPLVSPESYKELFRGCVGTQAGKQAIVDMITPEAYFEPPPTAENVDHSVGFLINGEDFPGRRKRGSGTWYGAAHTQYWIDPKSGIAGICSTQMFLFPPDLWYDIYVEYERTLYAQLERGGHDASQRSRW